MGIHATDLRELVVRPTLEQLDQWSPAAENLLLGTAAQESQLGFRLSGEQGKGIYRISDTTHQQIWDKFLVRDPELASRVRGLASQQQFLKHPHAELAVNLCYATGIAWMVYLRHGFALPEPENIGSLGQCWFSYFANREQDCHTYLVDKARLVDSEAELAKFDANYRKLVLRENKKLAA